MRSLPSLIVCLAIPLLALHPVATAVADDSAPKAPSFTVDGESMELPWSTVRDLGVEEDGILVSVGHFTVLLEPRAEYAFEFEKEPGRLHLIEDGVRRTVGVSRYSKYGDGLEKVVVDGFEGLTVEERRTIRGVTLDPVLPSDDPDLLAGFDAASVFFMFQSSSVGHEMTGKEQARPPALPTDARFLGVEIWFSDPLPLDEFLRDLTSLRFLNVEAYSQSLSAESLVAAPLEVLKISVDELSDVEMLSNLQTLRLLSLPPEANLQSVEFLSGMSELRELVIAGSPVRDLSPLAKLPKLRLVDARTTQVEVLPGAMPQLEELLLLGTPVSSAAVEQFKKKNPQCRVLADWTETLHEDLVGCDRLRVRSGGTCHRVPEEEKTLFELEGVDPVAEVTKLVQVDPRSGVDHCMCCGEPSLEFYRKGELVLTLGVHHGTSVRWDRGPWPGDAFLTKESGLALSQFLAKHEVPGPLQEYREQHGARRVEEQRSQQYRKLVPESVVTRLNSATSALEAVQAFIEGVPEKSERIALTLRLLGCDDVAWNRRFGLDDLLYAQLANQEPSRWGGGTDMELPEKDKISTEDVALVILANREDALVVRGGARWFISARKLGYEGYELREEITEIVGREAMSHPSQETRRETLFILGGSLQKSSTEVLRGVLTGAIQVRPSDILPGEQPGNIVMKGGSDDEVPRECADNVYAAFLLARRKDVPSKEKIEALLQTSISDEEKALLQTAMKYFGAGN